MRLQNSGGIYFGHRPPQFGNSAGGIAKAKDDLEVLLRSQGLAFKEITLLGPFYGGAGFSTNAQLSEGSLAITVKTMADVRRLLSALKANSAVSKLEGPATSPEQEQAMSTLEEAMRQRGMNPGLSVANGKYILLFDMNSRTGNKRAIMGMLDQLGAQQVQEPGYGDVAYRYANQTILLGQMGTVASLTYQGHPVTVSLAFNQAGSR